jgi:hypothetical protein
MCQQHWDALRAAISERGLDGLISGSGQKAVAKLETELAQGAQTPETYDPLMNANFAIWSNALEAGGLYLMCGDKNGNPYCPICESEKHGGQPADWWITHAADEQLEKARAMNLLPGIQ